MLDEPLTPNTALPIRLTGFNVLGLFNQFDYPIPLNVAERVTAVIAPNGSGKTVCLRMINALFRRQWSVFQSINFAIVTFTFSNGVLVQIKKDTKQETEDETPSDSAGIEVLIIGDGDLFKVLEPISWRPQSLAVTPGVSAQIERYLPFTTRVSPNRWIHDHSGQPYTTGELLETFSSMLPPSIATVLRRDEPEELTRIIEGTDCHLIETQRLLVLQSEERSAIRTGRRETSTLAISQKANALREIISRTLASYGGLSQSLDRSFPKRVIDQKSTISPDELRVSLNNLDLQRNSLISAGILTAERSDPVSIPVDEITPEITRLLSVYAEDNQKKLGHLTPLLQKVMLFKELIEERFIGKALHVDPNVGFRVTFHGANVPLERLSSGEQHQLVLFFELLFQLKSNALILIDEPELSLHVSWQRRFIPDLLRIIKLNNFDVILATHSPQLIAEWPEMIVELGEVDR